MDAKRKRRAKLLRLAAVEFRHMSSPFSTDWLCKHHVTLDECGDLSDDIANAIELGDDLAELFKRKPTIPAQIKKGVKHG